MSSITSPVLLVDKDKCMANIRGMKEKADQHGLTLKPHMKTHQSADIGNWMKEAGIESITVSSVKMAAYFAENGWNDITIAFPINPLELDAINKLASKIDLTLLISDSNMVSLLTGKLNHSVSVYIEIDTGSGRTGFTADQIDTIQKAVDKIQRSSILELRGVYSHPGHSYRSRSEAEILEVHEEARKQMTEVRQNLATISDKDLVICLGDTPCCSVGENFDGIDEISPGNFVFYDVMQTHIGSCSYEEIAVALAVPVVAVYPHRNEIAVHGGAVHLSKDHLDLPEFRTFGALTMLEESGWSSPLDGCYVKVLSQEHGIISCSEEVMKTIKVGDVLGILSIHSCLTADLMMGYQTLEGEKLNHIRTSHLYI